MQKKLLYILAFFAISISFMSCKSDNTPSGNLTDLNGTQWKGGLALVPGAAADGVETVLKFTSPKDFSISTQVDLLGGIPILDEEGTYVYEKPYVTLTINYLGKTNVIKLEVNDAGTKMKHLTSKWDGLVLKRIK